MSKADTSISALYDQQLVEEGLREVGVSLREQLTKDLDFVIDFCGKGELMKDLPWTLASIRRRASYMAPLHMMQIELLKRFRSKPESDRDQTMVQAMMITIAGIAAGLRNTG